MQYSFLPEPSLSPEQKAFNRRRFFQGRIKSSVRCARSFSETANELLRIGLPTNDLWSFYDNSALRAVGNNPIVQDEANSLRKAALS